MRPLLIALCLTLLTCLASVAERRRLGLGDNIKGFLGGVIGQVAPPRDGRVVPAPQAVQARGKEKEIPQDWWRDDDVFDFVQGGQPATVGKKLSGVMRNRMFPVPISPHTMDILEVITGRIYEEIGFSQNPDSMGEEAILKQIGVSDLARTVFDRFLFAAPLPSFHLVNMDTIGWVLIKHMKKEAERIEKIKNSKQQAVQKGQFFVDFLTFLESNFEGSNTKLCEVQFTIEPLSTVGFLASSRILGTSDFGKLPVVPLIPFFNDQDEVISLASYRSGQDQKNAEKYEQDMQEYEDQNWLVKGTVFFGLEKPTAQFPQRWMNQDRQISPTNPVIRAAFSLLGLPFHNLQAVKDAHRASAHRRGKGSLLGIMKDRFEMVGTTRAALRLEEVMTRVDVDVLQPGIELSLSSYFHKRVRAVSGSDKKNQLRGEIYVEFLQLLEVFEEGWQDRNGFYYEQVNNGFLMSPLPLRTNGAMQARCFPIPVFTRGWWNKEEVTWTGLDLLGEAEGFSSLETRILDAFQAFNPVTEKAFSTLYPDLSTCDLKNAALGDLPIARHTYNVFLKLSISELPRQLRADSASVLEELSSQAKRIVQGRESFKSEVGLFLLEALLTLKDHPKVNKILQDIENFEVLKPASSGASPFLGALMVGEEKDGKEEPIVEELKSRTLRVALSSTHEIVTGVSVDGTEAKLDRTAYSSLLSHLLNYPIAFEPGFHHKLGAPCTPSSPSLTYEVGALQLAQEVFRWFRTLPEEVVDSELSADADLLQFIRYLSSEAKKAEGTAEALTTQIGRLYVEFLWGVQRFRSVHVIGDVGLGGAPMLRAQGLGGTPVGGGMCTLFELMNYRKTDAEAKQAQGYAFPETLPGQVILAEDGSRVEGIRFRDGRGVFKMSKSPIHEVAALVGIEEVKESHLVFGGKLVNFGIESSLHQVIGTTPLAQAIFSFFLHSGELSDAASGVWRRVPRGDTFSIWDYYFQWAWIVQESKSESEVLEGVGEMFVHFWSLMAESRRGSLRLFKDLARALRDERKDELSTRIPAGTQILFPQLVDDIEPLFYGEKSSLLGGVRMGGEIQFLWGKYGFLKSLSLLLRKKEVSISDLTVRSGSSPLDMVGSMDLARDVFEWFAYIPFRFLDQSRVQDFQSRVLVHLASTAAGLVKKKTDFENSRPRKEKKDPSSVFLKDVGRFFLYFVFVLEKFVEPPRAPGGLVLAPERLLVIDCPRFLEIFKAKWSPLPGFISGFGASPQDKWPSITLPPKDDKMLPLHMRTPIHRGA